MASLPRADILQLVERAADRRRHTVLLELQRGVNSLATIVVIAPWLGILATVFGLFGSFQPINGEVWALREALIVRLCVAIIPTIIGLAVGISAIWLRHWLRAAVQVLDYDMRLGISEPTRQLRAFRHA